MNNKNAEWQREYYLTHDKYRMQGQGTDCYKVVKSLTRILQLPTIAKLTTDNEYVRPAMASWRWIRKGIVSTSKIKLSQLGVLPASAGETPFCCVAAKHSWRPVRPAYNRICQTAFVTLLRWRRIGSRADLKCSLRRKTCLRLTGGSFLFAGVFCFAKNVSNPWTYSVHRCIQYNFIV